MAGPNSRKVLHFCWTVRSEAVPLMIEFGKKNLEKIKLLDPLIPKKINSRETVVRITDAILNILIIFALSTEEAKKKHVKKNTASVPIYG